MVFQPFLHTHYVPGGFVPVGLGLWIIFLALVAAAAVVWCWLCFSLTTSTDLYDTHSP